MKKIKKILTGTLLSAISITAIGCGSTENKLAKNIDKSMAEFVTSINNLDYVDTTRPTSEKIGKIVETNADVLPFVMKNKKLEGTNKVRSNNDSMSYLNEKLSENDIENTIKRPTDRSGAFSLFILSDVPFVTLTSEDNTANLALNFKFSTNKIEKTSTEIDSKINTLILKRSILMIYVNEIYNGNVNFSEENKVAINAYLNVIKENTSYLNGNRGMVKNQLTLASDLVQEEKNNDLINYYIIKSGEALETRANKLDSTISAIDSIINIIESNLTSSSSYYNVKLSGTYENIMSNLKTDNKTETQIGNNSSNKEIADSILNSLDLTQDSFLISNNNQDDSNLQEKSNNLNSKTQTSSQDNNTLNDSNSIKNPVADDKNNINNTNLTPVIDNNFTNRLSNNLNQNNKFYTENINNNSLTNINRNQNNNLSNNLNSSIISNNLNNNNATTNKPNTTNSNSNINQNRNLQNNNINNNLTNNASSNRVNNTVNSNKVNNTLNSNTINNTSNSNRVNNSLNSNGLNNNTQNKINNITNKNNTNNLNSNRIVSNNNQNANLQNNPNSNYYPHITKDIREEDFQRNNMNLQNRNNQNNALQIISPKHTENLSNDTNNLMQNNSLSKNTTQSRRNGTTSPNLKREEQTLNAIPNDENQILSNGLHKKQTSPTTYPAIRNSRHQRINNNNQTRMQMDYDSQNTINQTSNPNRNSRVTTKEFKEEEKKANTPMTLELTDTPSYTSASVNADNHAIRVPYRSNQNIKK